MKTMRVPVFIYASDPLSAAGARALLMQEPDVELVGPDIDRARVALIIADTVDEGLCRVAGAIQRDGAPRLAAVASRFTEAGVLAAVAAGVRGFVRRSEASGARLVELISEVDAGGGLPPGLLERAEAEIMAVAAATNGTAAEAAAREEVAGLADEGVPGGGRANEDLGSFGHMPAVPATLGNGVAGPPCAVLTNAAERLSARESSVLRLMAEGLDTAEVAEQLSYSESTIKGVLAKIMLRLDARNRAHAVALAVRAGLI